MISLDVTSAKFAFRNYPRTRLMAWNLLGVTLRESGTGTEGPGMTKTKRTPRPKSKSKPKPLGTIWEIPDALWEKISPSSRSSGPRSRPAAGSPTGGRCSTGSSSGCAAAASGTNSPQARPQEHRPRLVPAVVRGGIMERIWAALVECDELGGVQWQWQRRRRDAGQGPVRGKRRARIPPIAARRGPRRPWWSTATAGRWGW